MTADFFRNRLDQMIDLRDPLAVLANCMAWQELEASLAHRFARQVRAGTFNNGCCVLICSSSRERDNSSD